MTDSLSTPLFAACGFVDLVRRGKLEMSGDDSVATLHKFCTNDIQNLKVGGGCEAFVLDAKGHIQFYVIVHRLADRMLLEVLADEADENTAARLAQFIDRYVIREKVKFVDRSADLAELLIAGDEAASVARRALGVAAPEQPLEHVICDAWGERALVARSVQTTAPNYTFFCPRAAVEEAKRRLCDAGAVETTYDVYDAARIEAGLPLLGRDIAEKALPQEIDRNLRTINFRKGCYLGQETVARLDALGHVNKTLVRLRLDPITELVDDASALPAAGTELRAGEQVVGAISSARRTPQGTIAALAMVRSGQNQPGKTLETAYGPAVVVARAD